MTLTREDNLRNHRRAMVDAMVADSPITGGYEVVGLSGGSKVWTDGRVEFMPMKVDWQCDRLFYLGRIFKR